MAFIVFYILGSVLFAILVGIGAAADKRNLIDQAKKEIREEFEKDCNKP